MTDSISRDPGMPVSVKISSLLALSLALLLTPISLMSCLAGSFVGGQMLEAGVVLGLFATLLFLGWRGLRYRRRWARRLLVFVSSMAFLGLLDLIGHSYLTGELDQDGREAVIWWLSVPVVCFETIALLLSSKTANPWFVRIERIEISEPAEPPFSLDGLRGLSARD